MKDLHKVLAEIEIELAARYQDISDLRREVAELRELVANLQTRESGRKHNDWYGPQFPWQPTVKQPDWYSDPNLPKWAITCGT